MMLSLSLSLLSAEVNEAGKKTETPGFCLSLCAPVPSSTPKVPSSLKITCRQVWFSHACVEWLGAR